MAKISTRRRRVNYVLLAVLILGTWAFFNTELQRYIVDADYWVVPDYESSYSRQVPTYATCDELGNVEIKRSVAALVGITRVHAQQYGTKATCPTKQPLWQGWVSPFSTKNTPTQYTQLPVAQNPLLAYLNPFARAKPSPTPLSVPLYSQHDPRWADAAYGKKTISCAGCGPTAVAMVLRAYGYPVTPSEMGTVAVQNGFYEGKGTEWNFFPYIAKQYNLKFDTYFKYDPITADPLDREAYWNRITQHLRLGRPVIVSGKGPAPFTHGGHFIVISRLNSNGTVMVNDPNDNNGNYPIASIKPYFRFVGIMYP